MKKDEKLRARTYNDTAPIFIGVAIYGGKQKKYPVINYAHRRKENFCLFLILPGLETILRKLRYLIFSGIL
jgi:hypothetical protein